VNDEENPVSVRIYRREQSSQLLDGVSAYSFELKVGGMSLFPPHPKQ
jgi:hypothetical protein